MTTAADKNYIEGEKRCPVMEISARGALYCPHEIDVVLVARKITKGETHQSNLSRLQYILRFFAK